jgi:acyl-CoA reductase-like NAD-dependent aldehyde dehydrogenase
MAWLRGRYYVRTVKRGGRVVHEYVGGGARAALAAVEDARQGAEREARAAAWRAAKDRLEALDAALDQLYETADRFARLALLAAGYHQHDRGEWRKRRDRTAQP